MDFRPTRDPWITGMIFFEFKRLGVQEYPFYIYGGGLGRLKDSNTDSLIWCPSFNGTFEKYHI